MDIVSRRIGAILGNRLSTHLPKLAQKGHKCHCSKAVSGEQPSWIYAVFFKNHACRYEAISRWNVHGKAWNWQAPRNAAVLILGWFPSSFHQCISRQLHRTPSQLPEHRCTHVMHTEHTPCSPTAHVALRWALQASPCGSPTERHRLQQPRKHHFLLTNEEERKSNTGTAALSISSCSKS